MKIFTRILKLTLFSLCIFFVTDSIDAQIQVPNSPPNMGYWNHNDPGVNLLIGRTNNLHGNADAFHQINIDANTVQYGNRAAIRTEARSVAGTGQSQGKTISSMSSVSDWFSNGQVIGISGTTDSVMVLDNPNPAWNATSNALGGSFSTRILNPISTPGSGTYYIAGSRSVLDGNITTYPTQGAVAAMIAQDLINGSGTWAGHFTGRGHFSGNVGIQNSNPLSKLSVNGDGDARWGIYSFTNSTTSGDMAVRGEAARPTGFADHVRAVVGTIESGGGYTYGVAGIATTDNPSANGRAYGVWGEASNATNGTNFGVYSRLRGSNGGTALLAHDDINHSGAFNGILSLDPSDPAKTWAGTLFGDVYMSNKVGIGTADFDVSAFLPSSSANDYRLFVCGGIIGKELFINSGAWCDYVFEKDYNLLSLEEVDQHIQEKGHLHNTPSAEQIEKQDGFEMGEMTRNQQEKIEEIYLHLIDMNKELKALKKENAELRKTIKEGKK